MGGFAEASCSRAPFRSKNGRTAWDRNTVVVVDEAVMRDALHRRAAGRRASIGAEGIPAGDNRHLASMERSGLFVEHRAAHRTTGRGAQSRAGGQLVGGRLPGLPARSCYARAPPNR